MRHWFGGNFAAVNEVDGVDGEDDIAQLAVSLTVTFWNLQTGGTQYTDLLDISGDPVTSTSTSDGGDGWGLGVVLPVQLPDGIGEAYASVDGGPRFVVTATDTGGLLETLSAAYAAHIAALNPHGTGLGDLTDASVGVAASRTDGDVLQWDDATQTFVLATPAAVSGTVLLDGGSTGNIAIPNSGSEDPWLSSTNAYSSGDTNPDFIVFYTRNATNNLVKVTWFNGNMELRSAPSLPNRIAFRAFENAEALNGASTGRFVEFSTNPTNTANREPLLGMYGTGHSTQPGWGVFTRVVAGLLGVRAGGSYNSLTAVNFRGLKTTSGAPSSGTYVQYDMVIDSAGTVWLCTVAGTPGTWVSSSQAAPTAFTNVTVGANTTLGTVNCGTRLDLGGYVGRMRGTLVVGVGGVIANATIGTVTAAHRPLHQVTTNARSTGGGARLRINTDGTIQYGAALAAADEVWLDNITWDLVA